MPAAALKAVCSLAIRFQKHFFTTNFSKINPRIRERDRSIFGAG
jgi:hypothetical protein